MENGDPTEVKNGPGDPIELENGGSYVANLDYSINLSSRNDIVSSLGEGKTKSDNCSISHNTQYITVIIPE